MTRTPEAIAAECEALYYDLDFAAARRWKDASWKIPA